MEKVKQYLLRRETKNKIGKSEYDGIVNGLYDKLKSLYVSSKDDKQKKLIADSICGLRELKNTAEVATFIQCIGTMLAGASLYNIDQYGPAQVFNFVGLGTIMSIIAAVYNYKARKYYKDEKEDLIEFIKNAAKDENDLGYVQNNMSSVQLDGHDDISIVDMFSQDVCNKLIKDLYIAPSIEF